MRKVLNACTILCLSAPILLQADVTVRYSYDVQPGSIFPPNIAEALRAQLKQVMGTTVPMQLKGNRAISGVLGIKSISDFDGEMITLIDVKQARYATAQKDEYLKAFLHAQDTQMKRLPEQARKAADQTRVEVTTAITGRTQSVLGIETEERQVTMTIGIPNTSIKPMRMVLSCWVPKAEETERNPMLRELRRFAERAYQGTGPATAAEKMFSQASGMAAAAQMRSAFRDTPVILSMRMSMFMPRPGSSTPTRSAEGAAALPAEVPSMEILMNLEELSAAEIPDSVFKIPREYTAVTMDEAIAGIYAQMSKPKPPASTPPVP